MSKLAVCGDSYWSPTKKLPKTHFSEIISDELNYELLPLSRSGSSNAIICLQIEKAIEKSADIVIFGCTFETRLTVAKKDFDLPFVLENTFSEYQYDQSTKYKSTKVANYTSISLNDSNLDDFTKKHFLVKENYHTLTTQQSWMISYWIEQLINNNIKFLFSPFQITKHNSRSNIVFDRYANNNIGNIPYAYEDFNNDPGYHTHPESQKLIARHIINKLGDCYRL